MLNLHLRDEFTRTQMPSTAIALKDVTIQESLENILQITYPTADIQTALNALSETRQNRPIVLIGERGRGKSHIMAIMHHAVQSPDKVEQWAQSWGNSLQIPRLQDLKLIRGYLPISEAVHNHEFPLLWDLLFKRHPHGQFYKGKFEQSGSLFPPRSLLEEMFTQQPTVLILDEFQKWFDGLSDDHGSSGRKWREQASNFIQNLSEISKDRPDIFILVISVLNNKTEAFQQVHRDTPVIVDFRGATASSDRKKLILHRLFSNRTQITPDKIEEITRAYAMERFRLRFTHLPITEQKRIVDDVIQSWPFSPELLDLLENQILMAEAAQETRDLIRILAQSFRTKGNAASIITPADFSVDDDESGVQSLLNSIATAGEQEKLRSIAQKNLTALLNTGLMIPNSRELVSAIWMRSMSPSNIRGATRQELQLDLTRAVSQDDNEFSFVLAQILDNSQNVHATDEQGSKRYWFGLEENPETMVKSVARNDKLWQIGTINSSTNPTYPAKDLEQIQKTLRHLLTPETQSTSSKVIVLSKNWRDTPWRDVDPENYPDKWNQPVLIVIPDPMQVTPDGRIAELGVWLKTHVLKRRNTVRFLFAGQSKQGIYSYPDLLYYARCSYLTSIEWRDDARYRGLKDKFDRPFRETLQNHFEHFAVLKRWSFEYPEDCVFEIGRVTDQGSRIPSGIEKKILDELFDPIHFKDYILQRASEGDVMRDIFADLYDPQVDVDIMPFIGDQPTYEQVLDIASQGVIAVNVRNQWFTRQPEHDYEDAKRYFKQRAYVSGSELRDVQLGLPSVVGTNTVNIPKPPVISNPIPVTSSTPTTQSGQLGSTSSFGRQPIAANTDSEIIQNPVTDPTPKTKRQQTYRSEEPNTGINLSGSFERWHVSSDATVAKARIEFEGLTVQQLKQILQRLPSSLRASLEISTDVDEV